MNFNEYQQQTAKTAIYPSSSPIEALSYVTMGLVGEAGEIANKVKKILRDYESEVTEEHRRAIGGEIGDVLWYLSQLATELDYELEWLADSNLTKLRLRAERGTLQGSGDNR